MSDTEISTDGVTSGGFITVLTISGSATSDTALIVRPLRGGGGGWDEYPTV